MINRKEFYIWLFLSLIWGSSFILIKISSFAFTPLWVSFLRSFFGALVLFLIFILCKEKLPDKKFLPVLFWVALLNNALPYTLFPLGEATVDSGIASILNATTPLFTLLLGFLIRDNEINLPTVIGVVFGFLGVIFTVFGNLGLGTVSFFGVAVLLIATLSYATATLLSRKKLKDINPLSAAFSQLFLSALMLLPTLFFTQIPIFNLKSFVAVAVLGTFGSGFAYLMFYMLLQKISATQVTAITYILPIWGLLWGYFAGEELSIWSFMGIFCIIIGLMLINGLLKIKKLPFR